MGIVIPKITNDLDVIAETIVAMTSCQSARAFDLKNLLNAAEMLPMTVTLQYEKLKGVWVFSNTTDDDYANLNYGHVTHGPNFAFLDVTPEFAIAKGVHYFYHNKRGV